MTRSRIDTRRLTLLSMLTAMALAAQYFEGLLPLPVPGVPVRLGLANVFTLYALINMKKSDACIVAILRCVAFALIMGRVLGAFYALSGSIWSFLSMAALLPLYKKTTISAMGLSAAGAFAFQLGQLLAGLAAIGPAILSYLPVMGLLSIPAGLATGYLAALVTRRLSAHLRARS